VTAPLIGRDGLLARKAGTWAKEKLDFLDTFGPPALRATVKKHDRIFLDLFAGPGLNVVPDTGEEFPGSPVRIAAMTAHGRPDVTFTRAIFCNLDPESDEALFRRLKALKESGATKVGEMECARCDSNGAVVKLLDSIDPRAYIFAFADIEGVDQLPWSTIEALRARHKSVDLYVLVPVEMSFNRLTGMKPAHRERHARALTAYFGCEEWRGITDQWITDAQGSRVRRELLEHYCARLRRLWSMADVVEVGRMEGSRLLYRMVFATDHDAGKRIAAWAKKRDRSNQGDLAL
jgi:three-Cys-motif partner protein